MEWEFPAYFLKSESRLRQQAGFLRFASMHWHDVYTPEIYTKSGVIKRKTLKITEKSRSFLGVNEKICKKACIFFEKVLTSGGKSDKVCSVSGRNWISSLHDRI